MFRSLGKFPYLGSFCFCQIDTKVFGIASRIGGRSHDSLYERYSGTFYNKDLLDYKAKVLKNEVEGIINPHYYIPGITVITTPEQCKKCVDVLMKTETIVAWDTETMDLDIKRQAPVGKGKIICASFFAGPQYNFGRGPRVFIDNFGKNAGLINYFKDYLQDEKYLKVWHNYGFDRHLFYNHGINVRGFGGDTMHMARLLDSGKMFGQYSLAALTKQYSNVISPIIKSHSQATKKQLMKKMSRETDSVSQKQNQQLIDNIQKYLKDYSKSFKINKTKMEEIFKRKKVLKSGTEGVSYQYPNTTTLHTNIEYIQKWIQYSTLDSQSTFYLRESLQLLLVRDKTLIEKEVPDMWKFYCKYWRPFGQVLTDIEREGIKLDIQHMRKIQIQAKHDLKKKEEFFLNFLYSFQKGKNIDHFNPSSSLQLQQLLFAPYQINPQKTSSNQKTQMKQESDEDKQLLRELEQTQTQAYELKEKGVRKAVTLNELVKVFKVDNKFGSKPKKIDMQVIGLGLTPSRLTPLGLPSVQQATLQILAGDPYNQKFGTAYTFYQKKGNPQFGRQLCMAIQSLIQYRNIETLLKTFIEPLASYADQNARIHCSLNINTETGRLSCRKPNLQNQPALDKDIYKIRKAFIADKGKKFIVADYGQLELRVLAHLTNCKAMITAFKQGGDFHSRTAIGMYDYIRKQIQEGTILLQWDKSKGKAPVPLLKDKYASERKKAKTVNFSIAYGKTAKGFAQDWGCSLQEAKKVIQAWFSDRKQVKAWQQQKQNIAENKKYTQTLLGRYRKLDKFFTSIPGEFDRKLKGMRMRRAINTPIQGGAADIVIASMIKVSRNKRLQQLGWKLLLQIHDQLIIQGPEQSEKQALQLLRHDMEHPFEQQLLVALEVDAKIGDNWYECK